MNVSSITQTGFTGVPVQSSLKLNRQILKSTTTDLLHLAGPEEKSAAKAWVVAYTAGNAVLAAATAQAPGFDEALLAGVEVVMATHIFNGIYDFKFSKTALKSLGSGVAGHVIGKNAFKLATKAFTWIPGIGNGLNAIVSGTTTAALGAALIDMAEDFDKKRRQGEKLDEFIKKMEQ